MEENKKNFKKNIKEYLPFTLFIICIILIRTFICTPINVNGSSMSTTLRDGYIMILNKIGLREGIERFDIVVIKTNDNYLIKRVIGLPGETISYKNEELYINGKKVEDKYNLNYTGDFDPVKLNKNEYYVMGDNRSISKDSRVSEVGTIDEKKILGKTNFIIYPFNKFGSVEE